ncbi:MAG TPA: hypothetical protein PKY77_21450 [Phycisphaerae bacterium]|nr:hypothetical protein [Phycisphaerae bacterium]HRY71147.1 hypothetical protein [Phycisphaerae bacterium]HSA29779.1 hypothetical protein [Phycisphaerae bacterium]
MSPKPRLIRPGRGLAIWLLIGAAGGGFAGPLMAQDAAGSSETATTDELMRPTQNGFRLTPEVVRLFSRQFVVKEVNKELGLSSEQIDKLSGSFAERTMDMGHQHGEAMRDLCEYWMETLMTTRGQKISPEMTKELGRRGAGFTPAIRELFKGFSSDARAELSDEQWAKYRAGMEEMRRKFDHLEETLQRWSRGELKPSEDTINGLEQEIDMDEKAAAKEPPAMRQARWQADNELQQIDPKQWRNYLTAVKQFFKYDEQQMVQAEGLLTKYRERAEALMVGDWRVQCRQNRMKYSMRWSLNQENVRPWIYHMEREYENLTGPIREVQREFQAAVIALATAEQREAAAAPIRERADQHGMPFDESDLVALGLGAQP